MIAPLVRHRQLRRNLPHRTADPHHKEHLDCEEPLVQCSMKMVRQYSIIFIERSCSFVAVVLLIGGSVPSISLRIACTASGEVALSLSFRLAFLRAYALYFSLAENLWREKWIKGNC